MVQRSVPFSQILIFQFFSIFEDSILLIFNNKETLIRYWKTSFLGVIFETVRLKKYVNILSIIAIFTVGAP